ncbi:Ribosome assembly factor mrt4 [Schistosoma japonicum]|uniref:Ribosome assembly factor mrt4 n=1 Tax=Schistosoma japonicum TaxID=6182 RepID=A0A4Z2DHU2_SCHJA|nr:Ribosome assembly factor mrt4 [Schistosoma japonicum]
MACYIEYEWRYSIKYKHEMNLFGQLYAYTNIQVDSSVMLTMCIFLLIEMSEFRVGLLAVWTDGDGVEELEKKDSCLMCTSLHPEVIVVCKRLDDCLYYFIPQPCENKNESSVNEAMKEYQ